MKLLIPKIGTKIVLTHDWQFKLSDEYRNETFWLSCHGQPKKKIYYYDPNNYYSGVTSPTPTAVCTRQGHTAADPIDTTIPAGTTLYIETFHMQKGHEPRLTLRIKKENKTKIPSGKFQVHIDDVNKMDVESELLSKYPAGRFAFRMSDGIDNQKYKCVCGTWRDCQCGFPRYTDRVLEWSSDPESRSRNSKSAKLRHRTDTAGLDEFVSKGHFYHRDSDYSKIFDNLQAFLNWAGKKGCTQTHIDAFLKQYEPLRIEWEKSKA